jgi:hypothetical protein
MDREKAIAQAIEDLETGKIKELRRASREYDVPRTTLRRRRNGATTHRQAHASQQALDIGEEEALIAYIQRCESQGFPIRHRMLKTMAEYLIQKRCGDPRRRTLSVRVLGHKWTYNFIKRHPFLKSLISRPLEQSRAKACTRENLLKWFDMFKHTMDKYKIQLENIYNIDETGFQMGATSRSYVIIDKRSGGYGHSGSGSKGENITAIETSCADGTVLPPFIIFKGEHLQSTWYSGDAPQDWVAVTSSSGWTNDILAMGWLQRIFEPHTQAKANGKHRMIIVDGHHSHLTPEFMEYCIQHRIILLCLPAHTTHLTQPLDVSTFSSVKHWFRLEMDAYLRCGETRVPKAEFMRLYAKSRPLAMTTKNIQSGFRKAGLIPYNPAAVLRQLPSQPLTPPPPTIPQEFLTPKDIEHLKRSIKERDELVSTGKPDDLAVSQKIQAKIDKATTTAFADRTILQQREQELLEHQQRKKAAASKKRKRVDPLQNMTVGEVNAMFNRPIASSKAKCAEQPPRTTRQRRRPATPELSDSAADSLGADEDSDVNSCIILAGAV